MKRAKIILIVTIAVNILMAIFVIISRGKFDGVAFTFVFFGFSTYVIMRIIDGQIDERKNHEETT